MSDKDVDFAGIVTRKSSKSAELETKEFSALLSIKSIDEKNRRITADASTNDIDRYDEIVEPESIRENLLVFMKNPVVLAAHHHKLADGTSPVVGNVVSAKIIPTGLEVIIEFHTITKLAEEYWQLYSQKKQRALSIGFKPLEGGFETINGKSVYVHRKIELLEISVVPIGANPNALSKSKEKKRAFIEQKIAQRQLDKDAEDFAEIMLTDDLSSYGIPEAYEDDFDLSGEKDFEPEPDYTKIATANSFSLADVCKDISELRKSKLDIDVGRRIFM